MRKYFKYHFPVLNTSIQTNYLGNGDAFIIVLDTNLSVIASTYLGGNGEDIIHNIYVNDYIYLTGYTSSADFPVKTTRVIVNHGNDMFAVYMTKSFSGGGGGFTGGDGELGTPAGVLYFLSSDCYSHVHYNFNYDEV